MFLLFFAIPGALSKTKRRASPTRTPFDRSRFRHPPFPQQVPDTLVNLAAKEVDLEKQRQEIKEALKVPGLDPDKKIDLKLELHTISAQIENVRDEQKKVHQSALRATPRPSFRPRAWYRAYRTEVLHKEQDLQQQRRKLLENRRSFLNDPDSEKEFYAEEKRIRDELAKVREEHRIVHEE
jgi:hypothetical protein